MRRPVVFLVEGHLLGRVAFIEVDAAGHHRNVRRAAGAGHQLAGVPFGGRLRPPGYLGVGDLDLVGQLFGESAQAAAEHDGDLRGGG